MLMPGEQIRLLRKEKGITQEQLAEAMNVSVAAVSKWETGQSAPELSLLCAIADYFAVSVDALLGHEVHRERLDDLRQAMTHAQRDRNAAMLRSLVDRTLYGYPNVYEAVEACADACYALFVQHGDRDALQQSIALTQRLFALSHQRGEVHDYTLMASLANQYQLIEDWEKALYYYEKSSVNGNQAANIALCKLKLGLPQEALTVISDHIQTEAFQLFQALDTLKEIYLALGLPEKALQALAWGVQTIGGLGDNPNISRILFLLQALRYALYHEQGDAAEAETALQEAAKHACIADSGMQELPAYAFLSVSAKPVWLSSAASYQSLLENLIGKIKEL